MGGKKPKESRDGGSRPFKAFCVGAIVEAYILYIWLVVGWLGDFQRECVPLVAKDKHFYWVRFPTTQPSYRLF